MCFTKKIDGAEKGDVYREICKASFIFCMKAYRRWRLLARGGGGNKSTFRSILGAAAGKTCELHADRTRGSGSRPGRWSRDTVTGNCKLASEIFNQAAEVSLWHCYLCDSSPSISSFNGIRGRESCWFSGRVAALQRQGPRIDPDQGCPSVRSPCGLAWVFSGFRPSLIALG